MAIAQRLGEQFSEVELAHAIDAETSGSDYYHERYSPRIIVRKGVKRWERENAPDLFLQPERWAAKQTTEIITRLGIDETDPTISITKEEFVQAADAVGVEATEANQKNLNEYKDRVLSRLDYVWDDEVEAFAPASAGRTSPDGTRPEGSSPTDAAPPAVTERADSNAEMQAEMDAPGAATPVQSNGDEDGGAGK